MPTPPASSSPRTSPQSRAEFLRERRKGTWLALLASLFGLLLLTLGPVYLQASQQPGNLALLLLCSLLALFALYRLVRDRQLPPAPEANVQSPQQQAVSALGALEERIMVTDHHGALSYLNPQAEALFRVSNTEVQGKNLLELVPHFDTQLLQAHGCHTEHGHDLLELELDGERRLFDIVRSDLPVTAGQTGFVWALRDVTEDQYATRVLQETRRRYQDIFEGTGTALCVLDLAELHQYLQSQQLHDDTALAHWLPGSAQR